jgi:DNA-binding GntR family transcriptional regulator
MPGSDRTRSSVVRPVDVTSAVDQVATEIRRAIVRGDLAAGSKFSLRDISDQLGVSFIPVREALRRLEAQGLVIIRPGRSAEVAPLDRDDLRAIYRLRKLIEPEVTGRASTMVTDEFAARMEGLLTEYADAEPDVERRWTIHRQFHCELLRPAATAWDVRTLEMLWDAGERYVRHAFDKLAQQPEEPERRVDAHRILLRVVCSGDRRAASAAALDHLTRNEETAVRGIEDSASAALAASTV